MDDVTHEKEAERTFSVPNTLVRYACPFSLHVSINIPFRQQLLN